MVKVFVAHVEDEQAEADKLAKPLMAAGYEVIHHGTVLVGESLLAEAQKVLGAGGPVVICATLRAAGSKWIRKISNAARMNGSARLFVMQMEGDADVEDLLLGEQPGNFWEDPKGALGRLVESLQKYYPAGEEESVVSLQLRAEATYRRLALDSCDIISLANLPEGDLDIATRKLELRMLYVPLHVRRKGPVGTHLDERELEERFEALRLDSGLTWDEQVLGRSTVGKRLASARRLVILGDPGSGKSTLLRWIATVYLLRLKKDPDLGSIPDVATLPDRDWLPILIRCRDLEPDAIGSPLNDVLRHTLRKSEMPDAEADALRLVLRDKLSRDEAILLIDGLDEISDTAARIRFCEQLRRIQSAYPNAAMVVTSRIVGYQEIGHHRVGDGFEHVLVDDLRPREKDEFVRRWCELTERPERKTAATEELIRDIHSTDRIERLTSNPMLLTTMALVKRKVGRLPRRRADLYWEAVHVLLGWRQAEAEDPLDAREARPQLQYLAFAMCEAGVQRFREDQVLEMFCRLRAEHPHLHAVGAHSPEQFLELLERRTGILVQSGFERHLGRPMPVYEFRHLTFQEYLAARALVEQCFPGARPGSLAETVAPLAIRSVNTQKTGQDSELHWHEVLRLFVACCPSKEVDAVLRAIVEVGPGENEAETALPRAVRGALCLADEPDVTGPLARTILERLGMLIEPEVNDAVLHDALRELAASRWREQTLDVLSREFMSRSTSRRHCILGMLAAGIEPFDFSSEQEQMLLADLSRPGDDQKAIIAAAHVAALSGQGGGGADAAPQLLALLDRGGAVSHAASYALLGLFHGYRISYWTPGEKDARRLGILVADPKSDPEAVCNAIALLGGAKATQEIEHLVPRLADPDKEIRLAAVTAVGQLGDCRVVDVLLQRLDDPESEVREAAVHSLGLLRTWRAFLPLQRMLGDASPSTRSATLSALKRLLSMRTDSRPEVGTEASAELARKVIPFLNGPGLSGTRALAASLLGLLRSREAVGPLSRLIEQWQPEAPDEFGIRYPSTAEALIHALGEIGDSTAAGPLRQALEHPEFEIQSAAAIALGKLRAPRCAAWLIPKLGHEVLRVRLSAAAGLLGLGDNRGSQLLQQALEEDEEDARREALRALTAIHGNEVDVELMTCFVPTYAYPVDPSAPIELWVVELLAKYFTLPLEEVRERFERLSVKIPLTLAWRTPAPERA